MVCTVCSLLLMPWMLNQTEGQVAEGGHGVGTVAGVGQPVAFVPDGVARSVLETLDAPAPPPTAVSASSAFSAIFPIEQSTVIHTHG